VLKEKSKASHLVYVEDNTKIGNNVSVGPYTLILSGARIQDDCTIGSHCILAHPTKLQVQKSDFSSSSPEVADLIVEKPITKISQGSVIRSGSTIYKHVIAGERLRTGHNALIREHSTLGKHCVIGTNAILDGYIEVGDGSMVQSNSYVAQSVRIGRGVFIAPGCVFMDNKKMVMGRGLKGALIEDYVRIGGATKILPGVTIGKHALIGAGSVISKDVPPKAVALGAPAQVRRFQKERDIKEYIDSIVNWE
jgi:acetyltransferase-like isoleucine patch superfamily enzyme